VSILAAYDALRPAVYALDLWLLRQVCRIRGHRYACNPWLRFRVCSRCERWEDEP
jgi:hypothetical protein